MKRILKLVSKMILVLLAPQFALGQWSEGQEGQLAAGCLIASVMSADRTRA
jgi:hypothetical protein